MFSKYGLKKSAVSAAMAAAFAIMAPGVAQAGALGQAILDISRFTITPLGVLAGSSFTVNNTGQVSAQYGDGTATSSAETGTTGNVTLSAYEGTPGYIAGNPLTGTPPSPLAFASSTSTLTGNALLGTAAARVDNTVSVPVAGSGSANGDIGLNSRIELNVQQSGGSLKFSFLADPFLRAWVDPNQTAFATIGYFISIATPGGTEIFNFSPRNTVFDSVFGGTAAAVGCNLNQNRSQTGLGDALYDPLCGSFGGVAGVGYFEATTNALAAGVYQLTISHTSSARAQAFERVPEPATLALVGLALLGGGVVSLRRRKI